MNLVERPTEGWWWCRPRYCSTFHDRPLHVFANPWANFQLQVAWYSDVNIPLDEMIENGWIEWVGPLVPPE